MTLPNEIWAFTYDIQNDDMSWDKDIPSWSKENPKPVEAVKYVRADLVTTPDKPVEGECMTKPGHTNSDRVYFKYYVFETRGPYGWQLAERETGPYYDTKQWFNVSGYDTEQEAEKAISDFLTDEHNYNLGLFFIIKGLMS